MKILYIHLGDDNYTVNTEYIPRVGETLDLSTIGVWNDNRVCEVIHVVYPITLGAKHYQNSVHLYCEAVNDEPEYHGEGTA